MSLEVFEDLVQGTDEWLAARCGLLTASVVGKLITPTTKKVANNDTSRAEKFELIAQRISGIVDFTYPTRDMERGTLSEPIAREAYEKQFSTSVTEVGFMIRTLEHGKLGYSPDGLVGDDGLIEIKAPKPKHHLKTIKDDAVPVTYMAQIQAGLLVSEREWCDFISYCGGMRLYVKRVHPDPVWQDAIRAAHEQFEAEALETIKHYEATTKGMPHMEYIDVFEEMVI